MRIAAPPLSAKRTLLAGVRYLEVYPRVLIRQQRINFDVSAREAFRGRSGMHPRNRYRERKPDFLDLARHRPSLLPFLIAKKAGTSSEEAAPYSHTVDFSNPDALR